MTFLDENLPTLHRHGSGPPLVMLHCLGVDRHFWDFANAMSNDFELLRYDLPGHGQSAVPDHGYRIEDLAAQLAELLRKHNIASAHVAGISLGGLIAQSFAAASPEMVDRLVLIDTTPRYSEELRAMWSQRAATARTAGVGALVDGLLPIWFTSGAIAANTAAVRYVRSALERASGEGYALACEALANADLRAIAAEIGAPTLVVCGDADIPSFLDAARSLEANIRNARLRWIADARHASVIERPESAVEILREFLLD